MFDWLIKLLGGYTKKEYASMMAVYEAELSTVCLALKQAKKNDTPRDPKTGRFVKK